MKQKVQFILFSLSIIILLILISCNESNIVENNVTKEKKSNVAAINKENSFKQITISDTLKKPIKRKDIKGEIVPNKEQACDWLVVQKWVVDYYLPKSGKTVGIWPYSSEYSVSNLYTLRTKWGYTGIYAGNATQYANARNLSAGYSKQNILRSCSFNQGTTDYKNIINSNDAGYYYIDEAVNHKCAGNGDRRLYSDQELEDVSNYIHTHRINSEFVSSGYKRCWHLTWIVNNYLDRVMYPSYVKWWEFPIATCYTNMGWGPAVEYPWIEGSDDQRDSWDDMRSRYSNKFSMTWINSNEDLNEYYDLFGKAYNIGLNSVWIYANYSNASQYYDDMSYAAWYKGFLRQFRRKYFYYYHCLEPLPCINCDDPDSYWVLDHIGSTNEVQEFYP